MDTSIEHALVKEVVACENGQLRARLSCPRLPRLDRRQTFELCGWGGLILYTIPQRSAGKYDRVLIGCFSSPQKDKGIGTQAPLKSPLRAARNNWKMT